MYAHFPSYATLVSSEPFLDAMLLADLGKARGCSTNNSAIHSLTN